MRILSLATPVAPVEIASWPDAALLPDPPTTSMTASLPATGSTARRSTRASNEFSTSPRRRRSVEIRSWTYRAPITRTAPGPTAARDRLYVCDEQNGQTLRVFDIANENVRPRERMDVESPVIIHNPG